MNKGLNHFQIDDFFKNEKLKRKKIKKKLYGNLFNRFNN